MAACREITNQLLAYLSGLLEEKEAQEVGRHLEACPACRKVLERLKKVETALGTEPPLKAPYRLNEILSRARALEQERSAGKITRLLFVSRLIAGMKKRAWMSAGLAFSSLALFFFLLFTVLKPVDRLMVLKVTGAVRVDGESFFNRSPESCRLDRRISFLIGDGELAGQVNTDKLMVAGSGAEFSLSAQEAVRIDLKQGLILGKAVREKRSKVWIIATDHAVFEITGTLFFVRAAPDAVECAVESGTVKTSSSNRSLMIHSRDKVRIRNNRVEARSQTDGEDEKLFDKIRDYVIRKDFRGMKKIVIKTKPEKSDVFWKNVLLGRSPLFMLAEEDQTSGFMVMQKGYISREMDLTGKREVTVSLIPEKPPETLWSMRRDNRAFYNPVYISGYILVTDESGWLYKIHAKSRKELWKFKMGKRNDSMPLRTGNMLYISSNDEYLYALDFETGKIAWRKKTGILVYSMPRSSGDRLYVCNNEGILYCLNRPDGGIIWARGVDRGIYSSPAVKNGILYVGGLSGSFYAIGLEKGNKVWEFRTGNRIVSSTPLIVDGRIFFGSNDRFFYALDLKTGKPVWKLDTGGEIFTSPALVEKRIVIGTVRGDLFCVEPDSGKVAWKAKLGEKILLNPYLAKTRYLYVVTDSNIYVVNRWGLLFTRYAFGSTGFAVSDEQDVYVCGQDGTLKNLRFPLR